MPVKENKTMHSHKFPFHDMNPDCFDFNLISTLAILTVYPFSRHSLYLFPCGFMLLWPLFSLYWTSLFLRHSFTYLPVSGALSLFPFSLVPLLSCPTLLPSSLAPSVILVLERESQRTCLFINVSKGSRWRRKTGSERWGEGRGKIGDTWQREKVGKSEREKESPSTVPVNWWRGWSDAPRVSLEQ